MDRGRKEGSRRGASPRVVHDMEGLNTAAWPVAAEHLVTPAELFFTRSHASVPAIEAGTWQLEVGGLVQRPTSFSLEQLERRFPKREVTATIVCAGLRREEFLALGPLPGELPWGAEPISTGCWTGIGLSDVLGAVGVTTGARHVEFTGLDQVERHDQRFGFGGSIDLEKALGAEVLLATELNGAPLPRQHGFPLRAMVPGWIGARSVKWLGRITLLEDPSDNYFQSHAYRFQREIDPLKPRDVSAGVALSAIPLNSAIVEPIAGAIMSAGRTRIRGWAIGNDGRSVKTVDVSGDGGGSWIPANITHTGERWSWSLWEGELTLPRGRHVLAAKATDSSGATQPASVSATWNVKGYNNNAWHRVLVVVE
jgi:sulfite oxidase